LASNYSHSFTLLNSIKRNYQQLRYYTFYAKDLTHMNIYAEMGFLPKQGMCWIFLCLIFCLISWVLFC